MLIRPIAFGLLLAILSGCASTPEMELELRTEPEGARVYLSRRGKKAYQAKLGPVKGDVKAETFEEEFLLIGTSPLVYTTPLRATESDATLLGVGGKVVLKFDDGVLRFEKPGYETIEQHVRFHDGDTTLEVALPPKDPVAVLD